MDAPSTHLGLNKKIGPLPGKAWVGIAVVGVAGGLYLRSRDTIGTSGTDATQPSSLSGDTTPDANGGSSYGGGDSVSSDTSGTAVGDSYNGGYSDGYNDAINGNGYGSSANYSDAEYTNGYSAGYTAGETDLTDENSGEAASGGSDVAGDGADTGTTGIAGTGTVPPGTVITINPPPVAAKAPAAKPKAKPKPKAAKKRKANPPAKPRHTQHKPTVTHRKTVTGNKK